MKKTILIFSFLMIFISQMFGKDEATIYFRRPFKYAGSAIKHDLEINNLHIGAINSGGQCAVTVPAGSIIIKDYYGNSSLEKRMQKNQYIMYGITAEAGKSYYLKINESRLSIEMDNDNQDKYKNTVAINWTALQQLAVSNAHNITPQEMAGQSVQNNQYDGYSTVYLTFYDKILPDYNIILEVNDNDVLYMDEGKSYITIKTNMDKIKFRVWYWPNHISYESLKEKDNNETKERRKAYVYEYRLTPNSNKYLMLYYGSSLQGDTKENFEKKKNNNKIKFLQEYVLEKDPIQEQQIITQPVAVQPVNAQYVVTQPVVETTSGIQLSDVDVNIPQTNLKANNTFVLIIANEHYTFVDNVDYAIHDGEVFKEYCIKTLGVPERQVWFYQDATGGIIAGGVDKMVQAMSLFEDSKAIVYYCGHGIPDEHTGDAYIVPTDGKGTNTATCYSLNKMYTTLAKSNAKSVTYFMDACFSGANKEGSMLVAARGVAREAKKETLTGNTVVFSAASGDETAMTFKEKGHGLFTYFLLKKLQETNGDVSYGDLDKYIKDNVKRESFLTNEKVQHPATNVSENSANTWKQMKLK